MREAVIKCSGCRLVLPCSGKANANEYRASAECVDLFYELCAYTLSHRSPEFIHQYVVDAYAAQHIAEDFKQIRIAFAVLGLYLMADKSYTGRQVQLAHMELAKIKPAMPRLKTPDRRGQITVQDVLNEVPGNARDEAIRTWARDVWKCWNSEAYKLKGMVDMLSLDSLSRRSR